LIVFACIDAGQGIAMLDSCVAVIAGNQDLIKVFRAE